MAIGNSILSINESKDAVAPVQRGLGSLASILTGIQNQRQEVSDALGKSIMTQEEIIERNRARAERENERLALARERAAERAYQHARNSRSDKVASTAQATENTIANALMAANGQSFTGTPAGGINPGAEIQQTVNTLYSAPADTYTRAQNLFDESIKNNQALLDEEKRKGDAIVYDAGGNSSQSTGLSTAISLDNSLKTQKQALEYKKLSETYAGTEIPSQLEKTFGMGFKTAPTLQQAQYQENIDTDTYNKRKVTENYNARLADLNKNIQAVEGSAPGNLLDTITNPERVGRELSISLMKQGVPPSKAVKAGEDFKKSAIKPVDKTLVEALKDERKQIEESIPTVIKTEGGSGSGSSGNASKSGWNDSIGIVENVFKNSALSSPSDAYWDTVQVDNRKDIQENADILRKTYKKASDRDIGIALINSIEYGSGGSRHINLARAEELIKSGRIPTSSANTDNTKIETKTKIPTTEQAAALEDINKRLYNAQNPNLTIASVLGKDIMNIAKTPVSNLGIGMIEPKDLRKPKEPTGKPFEKPIISPNGEKQPISTKETQNIPTKEAKSLQDLTERVKNDPVNSTTGTIVNALSGIAGDKTQYKNYQSKTNAAIGRFVRENGEDSIKGIDELLRRKDIDKDVKDALKSYVHDQSRIGKYGDIVRKETEHKDKVRAGQSAAHMASWAFGPLAKRATFGIGTKLTAPITRDIQSTFFQSALTRGRAIRNLRKTEIAEKVTRLEEELRPLVNTRGIPKPNQAEAVRKLRDAIEVIKKEKPGKVFEKVEKAVEETEQKTGRTLRDLFRSK